MYNIRLCEGLSSRSLIGICLCYPWRGQVRRVEYPSDVVSLLYTRRAYLAVALPFHRHVDLYRISRKLLN